MFDRSFGSARVAREYLFEVCLSVFDDKVTRDEFLKLFKFSKERIRVNFWLLHWHLRKIVVVFEITKMFHRN